MADYTSAQLAALRAALTSGTLTVEYDGKRVTYRSLAEIERAISIVSASLDRDAGTVKRRAVRLYADGKGN